MPPIGSFEFEMLNEGVKRKRAEKLAFARFIAKFLAPMAGLSSHDVVKAIAEYAEELTQLTYNWDYETVGDRINKVYQAKVASTKAILDKVAEMTVE